MLLFYFGSLEHNRFFVFDPEFSQLLRITEEKKEAFPDPLIQTERQRQQFQKWLNENCALSAVIKPLVVISSPRTILESSSNHILFEKVIHSAKLPFVISSITKSSQQTVNQAQLNVIANKIIDSNRPLNTDILSRYNILPQELLPGIICPKCVHAGMVRNGGSWHCPICRSRLKKAHLNALKDYYLLRGPAITSKEATHFLRVSSESVIRKMLTALNIQRSGKTKGTVYYLTASVFEAEKENWLNK